MSDVSFFHACEHKTEGVVSYALLYNYDPDGEDCWPLTSVAHNEAIKDQNMVISMLQGTNACSTPKSPKDGRIEIKLWNMHLKQM